MPRSPLFRKIASLINQAAWKNDNPQSLDIDSNRREFLKSSLVTSVALLPLTQVLTSCASTPAPRALTSTTPESPVIILGAGIAGLTAAYRLTQASVPCEIYEASPRVGGRIFTKRKFNGDGMTCELGGELVDSNHDDLIGLCNEFGIPLDDFAPGDAGLVSSIYYLNQKYYTDKELIPLFQPFAKKLRRDQKKILSPKIEKAMDKRSLEQYLAEFHGVEKWILELIRIAYVGECGIEASEQSALNLLYILSPDTKDGFKIYGDSDEAKKIRGGNSSLIEALEAYLKSHGVPIYTQSPLLKIAETTTGIQLTLGKDKAVKTINSKKVICTIPFTILRNIEGVSALSLEPKKKKLIQELAYGTCGKMMIGYQKKTWRGALKKGDQSIPASNGMVYTDLTVQNLWETSRTQSGNSGILTSFSGGKAGAAVSASQKDAFIDQIDSIFPGTKEIHDGNFAVMNWTNMPYNLGAYSTLKTGQAVEYGSIDWTPELSGQLIFAGEHTDSEFQGFMNGACRSGNKAAKLVLENKEKKSTGIKGYL